MRTNWKKLHKELVEVSELRYKLIEQRVALLSEALCGGMELVARLPGLYSNEFKWVYHSRKTGRVVVIEAESTQVYHYDSLQAFCDFMEFWQSDLPHNLESVRILKEKLANAA